MIIRKVTDKLLHITEDKAQEAKELVTCAHCGLTFRSSNSTAEAKADFERDFPGQPFEPGAVALVCGSCYQKIRAKTLCS